MAVHRALTLRVGPRLLRRSTMGKFPVLAPFWGALCNLGAIIRNPQFSAPRNPCRRPEPLPSPRNPCRASETLAARPEPLAAPQNLLQPAALTAQRNPDCTEKPRLHEKTPNCAGETPTARRNPDYTEKPVFLGVKFKQDARRHRPWLRLTGTTLPIVSAPTPVGGAIRFD